MPVYQASLRSGRLPPTLLFAWYERHSGCRGRSGDSEGYRAFPLRPELREILQTQTSFTSFWWTGLLTLTDCTSPTCWSKSNLPVVALCDRVFNERRSLSLGKDLTFRSLRTCVFPPPPLLVPSGTSGSYCLSWAEMPGVETVKKNLGFLKPLVSCNPLTQLSFQEPASL